MPDTVLTVLVLQNLHDTAALRRGEDTLIKQELMGNERLFLGRTRDGNTGLFLRDDKGVPRLRICVSKENKPLIQVLDDEGQPSRPGMGRGNDRLAALP